MKRPPARGEAAIRHITADTGDTQTFAICDANYAPDVIARMPGMETAPVHGYMLDVGRGETAVAFTVRRGDVRLTVNTCQWAGNTLILTTALMPFIDPSEAGMLADLEQCAAIALCPRPR